jgi:hypothetical protein
MQSSMTASLRLNVLHYETSQRTPSNGPFDTYHGAALFAKVSSHRVAHQMACHQVPDPVDLNTFG